MKSVNTCPMPQTHSRLHEAHRFWHEAEKAYQDPSEFTAKLNALLQALRNVTFVMQKELSKNGNFEKWYAEQQVKMKMLDYMRWAVDARNYVVKQGDLEKKSFAKVTLLTYEDNPVVKEEVPPFLGLTELLAIYAKRIQNPDPRWDVVLEVERSWIITDFPKREILLVLQDVFQVLHEMLSEWHTQHGVVVGMCSVPNALDPQGKCTMGGDRYRTIRSSLNDGGVLTIESHAIEIDDEVMSKANKRYQIKEELLKNGEVSPEWNDVPWTRVNFFMQAAKKILQKDKYHDPLFFLFKGGSLKETMPATYRDRPEKYLFMRNMGKHIIDSGIDGVVFITESWRTVFEPDKDGNITPPSDAENREEILSIYIATSDGRARSYETIFTRNWTGKIRFNEVMSSDIPRDSFMTPIFRAWEAQSEKFSSADRDVKLEV